MFFDWDDSEDPEGNTWKISQRLDPDIYEYIYLEGNPVLIEVQEEEDERRFRAVGADPDDTLWTFVYTYRDEKIRPIAAWKTANQTEIRKWQFGRPKAP